MCCFASLRVNIIIISSPFGKVLLVLSSSSQRTLQIPVLVSVCSLIKYFYVLQVSAFLSTDGYVVNTIFLFISVPHSPPSSSSLKVIGSSAQMRLSRIFSYMPGKLVSLQALQRISPAHFERFYLALSNEFLNGFFHPLGKQNTF